MASNGKISLTNYTVKTKSKGKKSVLLLSSKPNLPSMGFTKDRVKKPAIIKDYDFGMGATDWMDQRCAKYTTNIATKKFKYMQQLCY